MTSTDARAEHELEAMRTAFLAQVKELRPRLHRFCTRMTGSVMDGEDVVQETLAQAFSALPSLNDASRLEPWLFRIAHNKSVDFIRRERRPREGIVMYEEEHVPQDAHRDPADEPVDEALAALVSELPPMERACVLLKDVLDYRLAEIAEIVDSTVGGVKAALHRGRTKLRAPLHPRSLVELAPDERRLIDAYIDHFNRRDWDGLRRLIQTDVRIEIVGMTETESGTYFSNYTRLPWEWRFGLAHVDGEPLVVLWRKAGDEWAPHTAVRLWWRHGKVVRIRDYVHVDYLLESAHTVPR